MRLDVLHIKTYHMLMVMTNITVGLLYLYIATTLVYSMDPPYPMDPPCGPTLWTHPMDPPYGPTLHGPTHSSPILVPLCSNSVGKWCG